MYKYETHLHTYPVSACGKKSVRENLEAYKAKGYDGVFITNHFLDGNINIDSSVPYEDKIDFFESDYKEALKIGNEIGIKVFFGIENSYLGTHFLIYGLDCKWYKQHPEIMDMKRSNQLAYLAKNGAFVVQAHPFREADYIDHIRLFPRHVHAVEIINACCTDESNKLAYIYAEHYGLLKTAGSDNHFGGDLPHFAGMSSQTPIKDEADFIAKIKNNEMKVFYE